MNWELKKPSWIKVSDLKGHAAKHHVFVSVSIDESIHGLVDHHIPSLVGEFVLPNQVGHGFVPQIPKIQSLWHQNLNGLEEDCVDLNLKDPARQWSSRSNQSKGSVVQNETEFWNKQALMDQWKKDHDLQSNKTLCVLYTFVFNKTNHRNCSQETHRALDAPTGWSRWHLLDDLWKCSRCWPKLAPRQPELCTNTYHSQNIWASCNARWLKSSTVTINKINRQATVRMP